MITLITLLKCKFVKRFTIYHRTLLHCTFMYLMQKSDDYYLMQKSNGYYLLQSACMTVYEYKKATCTKIGTVYSIKRILTNFCEF